MLPPPPLRFSATTCQPSRSPRCLAIRRARMSRLPPGAEGTTMRMGLAGNCCAAAERAAVAPSAAAVAVNRRLVARIIAFVRLRSVHDEQACAGDCQLPRLGGVLDHAAVLR